MIERPLYLDLIVRVNQGKIGGIARAMEPDLVKDGIDADPKWVFEELRERALKLIDKIEQEVLSRNGSMGATAGTAV